MDILKIRQRLEKLGKRERIISFLTVIVIALVIPYQFLYLPSSKRLSLEKTAARNLKLEIESLSASLSSFNLQQKLIEEPLSLPVTEDLAGMFSALTREASLSNVEFISLTPESFTDKSSYVEMKIRIELRVRFKALYDFLRNVEANHRLFMVNDIKFETNDAVYPSGIALIRAIVYLRKT